MPWDTVKVESRHTSTPYIIHTSIQKLHSRTTLLDIQVLSNVNTFRQKHCVLSMSLTSGLESPEVIWLGLAQIALHAQDLLSSKDWTGLQGLLCPQHFTPKPFAKPSFTSSTYETNRSRILGSKGGHSFQGANRRESSVCWLLLLRVNRADWLGKAGE